jgi:hypothetical protein
LNEKNLSIKSAFDKNILYFSAKKPDKRRFLEQFAFAGRLYGQVLVSVAILRLGLVLIL